jgi:hypothetical protein
VRLQIVDFRFQIADWGDLNECYRLWVEKLSSWKIRKNEIAPGRLVNDLLGLQDIFYPPNFGRLGAKASSSTPTPLINS